MIANFSYNVCSFNSICEQYPKCNLLWFKILHFPLKNISEIPHLRVLLPANLPATACCHTKYICSNRDSKTDCRKGGGAFITVKNRKRTLNLSVKPVPDAPWRLASRSSDWLLRHVMDEYDVIGGEYQGQCWNGAGFTVELKKIFLPVMTSRALFLTNGQLLYVFTVYNGQFLIHPKKVGF